MNGYDIVEQTCETFTRLLLSLTPYKAKAFVEGNCSKVTDKILASVTDSLRAEFKEVPLDTALSSMLENLKQKITTDYGNHFVAGQINNLIDMQLTLLSKEPHDES